MRLAPQQSSTVGYLALVVLLFAGLGMGLMLFVLQARGPAGDAEFLVAPPASETCPTGSGVPVCYRFDVTNIGAGAAMMRCVVAPKGDATAEFTASGSSVYDSPRPVESDETYPMYVEVDAGSTDNEIAAAPSMGCGPAG